MRSRATPAPVLRSRQRGVATLLTVALLAAGLAAVALTAVKAVNGSAKVNGAEHAVTQAEMKAWAGVVLLSKAVAAMPTSVTLQPGAEVAFSGTQQGLKAWYRGLQGTLYLFDVQGRSGDAFSTVRVALKPPTGSGGSSNGVPLPGGMTLRGATTLEGSVAYTGTAPRSLYVLDGPLTLGGSVTGLQQICATGNITVGAAINVTEICSNGSVTLNDAATTTRIRAKGDVTLAGGAASSIGDILSNGAVSLTGGSATATSVRATGNVTVGTNGGSARANTVVTEGSIVWTSTAVAGSLSANGSVNYRPSGTTEVRTTIDAIGNVSLTSAGTVRTKGTTTLVGYWGQGVNIGLQSQGQLSGSSWGSGGGAVVASGTVGSIASPYPGTVRVTVAPGFTVTLPAVSVPVVETFQQPRLTVDAYALQASANLAFLGVDSSGNPRVQVAKINGVTDGSYFIANKPGTGANFLCKNVSGPNCTDPLIKVCQGYSNSNRCFSFASGSWTIEGTTMLPGVLWFEGNLNVSNGTWVNTFLATGNITTSGGLKVYSPNFIGSAVACQGNADSTRSLASWTASGFPATAYATQLCSGTPALLSSASIGNIALLAGGLRQDGSFVGGNVYLGSSNEIHGSVLAGQYLNTGGSTVVTGSMYAAAQGGSTAYNSNRAGGSTTIRTTGGSGSFDPDVTPCMANCSVQQPTGANVMWAAPI